MTQQEHLARMQLLFGIKRAWRAACAAEGIPEDSTFVVFADDNNAANTYNQLMINYQEFMKEIKP